MTEQDPVAVLLRELAEKNAENVALRQRVRRLTVSREMWKERALESTKGRRAYMRVYMQERRAA